MRCYFFCELSFLVSSMVFRLFLMFDNGPNIGFFSVISFFDRILMNEQLVFDFVESYIIGKDEKPFLFTYLEHINKRWWYVVMFAVIFRFWPLWNHYVHWWSLTKSSIIISIYASFCEVIPWEIINRWLFTKQWMPNAMHQFSQVDLKVENTQFWL